MTQKNLTKITVKLCIYVGAKMANFRGIFSTKIARLS